MALQVRKKAEQKRKCGTGRTRATSAFGASSRLPTLAIGPPGFSIPGTLRVRFFR